MGPGRTWLRALALLSFAGLSACADKGPTDEEQIAAMVRRAITAANEKKTGEVVADAADDFKGPGGADVRESRRMLLGYTMQAGWLSVFERRLDVVVEGEVGRVTLDAVLARGDPVKSIEDLLPTNATGVRFELEVAKRDGAWKFTQAAYRQLASPL